MSELTTLARPYAKAAFEFALEQDNLAGWSDMLSFLSLVLEDKGVSALLDSPSMTKDKATEVVLSVAKENLNDYGINYVRLLASNGRLELLPEILHLFETNKAEYEKTIDVEMTSAIELSDQQLTELNQRLVSKLGRKVNINCQIDPTVMGGYIIRAGDLVIDASIRGKLA
ncbi:MAG: F0F1 ATP synthase subunit delta, partial [Gammaproteobacteria bacterium]